MKARRLRAAHMAIASASAIDAGSGTTLSVTWSEAYVIANASPPVN